MATEYGTTADGYVQSFLRLGSGGWATARSDTSGFSMVSNATRYEFAPLVVLTTRRGTGYGLRRSFFYFDTSGISDAPSAATLKIYGYSQNSADVIAVRGTQSATLGTGDLDAIHNSSTELSSSNGSGAGTLASVSGLTYSGEISTWSTSGYNDIALNATARLDMASLDDFKVCLMEYDHDYLDVAPTAQIQVGLYYADAAGENSPYIDYTVAAVTHNATFFGANF
jgi:hypothetical protein